MHRLHAVGPLAFMALLLSAPNASALEPASVTFDSVAMDGTQDVVAESKGLRIQASVGLPDAKLTGGGVGLGLTTTNYTLTGAFGVIGTPADRGGSDWRLESFAVAGELAKPGLDIVIVPRPDGALPRLTATTATLQARHAQVSELRETAYVDSTRPVLAQDVGKGLQGETMSVGRLRVEGSFMVSIWSWNFTAGDSSETHRVATGSYRTPLRGPVPGQQQAYSEQAQVATLDIQDGWLEVSHLYGASVVAYGIVLDVSGTGSVEIEGTAVAETDRSGLPLNDSRVSATGDYALRMLAGEDQQDHLELQRLAGFLQVDGVETPLGGGGPIRGAATATDPMGTGRWVWPLTIIALAGMAFFVKGPAMMGRFNRIQMRFDRKDYTGVLAKIDSFTRRSKYARRAAFLKTVSLLSLGEYREASLYLQTLAPHQGPEPATRQFLQACAAAGLGQDSTAIQHLSECLKDDPSYMEEAKTVPVLAGYLPYFTISPGEAGT